MTDPSSRQRGRPTSSNTQLSSRNKNLVLQSPQNQERLLFVYFVGLNCQLGRAIAQAVSRRLPTAAARVRARLKSRRICDGPSDVGAGFLQVLRFPLPILIPSTAPHSSSSMIRGWHNRPKSGRRSKWTWSPRTPSN
jgi:hypothetical protein